MSTVAFISGYNLSRAATFQDQDSVRVDIMSDGTPRVRTLIDDTFTVIPCLFEYLTLAEKNALLSFLRTNRPNTITWTIDGIDYSGVIVKPPLVSMTGPLFNVGFDYYAQVV